MVRIFRKARFCPAGARYLPRLLMAAMLLPLGAAQAAPPASSASPASPATAAAPVAAKKFATDEVLRQGMARMAVELNQLWPEIQARRLKTPAYHELARQVDAGKRQIIQNCKLDARADHAFHELLADMNQAVLLMQRDKAEVQHAGALALAQVLRNYARFFDHPGWTGPQP